VTYPKTVGEFCDYLLAHHGKDTPFTFTWMAFEGWRFMPYCGLLEDFEGVGLGIKLSKDTNRVYDLTKENFYGWP